MSESASKVEALATEPEIPPGLDIFIKLDKMMLKQEIELLEIFCGCEGKNHYSVKDDHGREIMRADEITCCCWMRCLCSCCKSARPFTFTLNDFEGNFIYVERKISCNTCWCPCCMNKMVVYHQNGEILGHVNQRWSLCNTYFYIRDANNKKVLKISGPCCTSKCCCDVVFLIESMDGTDVGRIAKKWGGLLKEVYTDADSFDITFPKDLDVRIKATLVGAALLIDFMFFENQQPKT